MFVFVKFFSFLPVIRIVFPDIGYACPKFGLICHPLVPLFFSLLTFHFYNILGYPK